MGAFFLSQDLAAIHALRDACFTGADGTSSCRPGYKPDDDNAKKNRSFGLFVGLGGAGVAAIGAAVVGIARAPSAKKPALARATLAPWAGPGGAASRCTEAFDAQGVTVSPAPERRGEVLDPPLR